MAWYYWNSCRLSRRPAKLGARVAALGAGPLPIPRSQLTADRLVQAIERAMDDQALRLRAAKLGRKIKAENGIGAAKEFIREYH